MINLFLKAKHWQLFLFMFAAPILLNIMTPLTFSPPTAIIIATLIASLLFIFGILGWIYSIVTGLHRLLPETVQINLKTFQVLFFIPCVYITVFLAWIYWLTSFIPANSTYVPIIFEAPFIFIVIGLHLFSMFCMFRSAYIAAKTIKAVQLQKPVSFGDFAGEFFLIWFCPVGIWVLQPGINKLAKPTL